MDRYLAIPAKSDLKKKMLLLSGPRQVGKTTLSMQLGESFKNPVYLNWDDSGHKLRIKDRQWPPESGLIVLDEIHKMNGWKGWVKGVSDTKPQHQSIMLTGSARLNIYKKGGDSLLGRYHHYRLHPVTASEHLGGCKLPEYEKKFTGLSFDKSAGLEELFKLGGFPEPLLSGSEKEHKRWLKERHELVLREDVRDLEEVKMLGKLELLGLLIPGRVGSPLSVQSLVEDVGASHKTLQYWLDVLARVYFSFKVMPYSRHLARALKKEHKIYLWDWSQVENDGARFENMVASHLLKWCNFQEDVNGIKAELWYLRDREKRETDFLVTWEGAPAFLVECKLSDESPSPHLTYFGSRLGIKDRYHVTLNGKKDYLLPEGTRVIPASKFLAGLI